MRARSVQWAVRFDHWCGRVVQVMNSNPNVLKNNVTMMSSSMHLPSNPLSLNISW
jgi:hypothetical protein